MKDDGWREAMTGTITFYNKYGERMHTIYTAAPPEYGKQEFFKKFEKEIKLVREQFSNTFNRSFLKTQRKIIILNDSQYS